MYRLKEHQKRPSSYKILCFITFSELLKMSFEVRYEENYKDKH